MDKEILQGRFDEFDECFVFSEKNNDQRQIAGHGLLKSFGEVAQYAKPQPSLLPNVDETLRAIGQWRYLIETDFSSVCYRIPLSQVSMKITDVCTPFRGIRTYTRCAMGMPGSEIALEELMCRVLGDLITAGTVAKIADDLCCAGSTIQVLRLLSLNELRLAPKKTVICPSSTTILRWL